MHHMHHMHLSHIHQIHHTGLKVETGIHLLSNTSSSLSPDPDLCAAQQRVVDTEDPVTSAGMILEGTEGQD